MTEWNSAEEGEDVVVFATDHPFGPEGGRTFPRRAVDLSDSIDDADAREDVFGGTVRSLL